MKQNVHDFEGTLEIFRMQFGENLRKVRADRATGVDHSFRLLVVRVGRVQKSQKNEIFPR